MWRVCSVIAVIGCGSGNQHTDAGADSSGALCSPRPDKPECGVAFEHTCGNGVIDNCINTLPNESFPACPQYIPMTEECDGLAGPTCLDAGYFGGTSGCSSSCSFDASGCSACATNASVTDCVTSPEDMNIPVAFGSFNGHIAIAHIATELASIHDIAIYDDSAGLVPVATTMYPDAIEAIVGVPNGWLVKTSGAVDMHVLVNDGTHVADRAAGLGHDPQMVYGPGGHALVIGTEMVNSHPDLWAAVIDANANTIVAPFVLAPASDDNFSPSLTTDGTSFFVGTRGVVRRLDGNANVISVATGFPSAALEPGSVLTTMSWNGTSGWYLALEDVVHSTYLAQTFDSTGAPIGTPISITVDPTTTIADGSGLLTVTATPAAHNNIHLQLVHLDATGAVISTTEVGAGQGGGQTYVHVARFDATRAVLTWQATGKRQLALVSAP